MRSIRVTGKGLIRLRPDTTRIVMTLEDVCADYGETLRRSSKVTEALKSLLSELGFERTALKTVDFGVDTEYESDTKKGSYRERFVGYRFRHIMKLEFPSDNDRLGKVLFALTNCPGKPKFRISYTVSDPEAAKNELLGKAVADAKEKASVLTKAAGVSLKALQSVDYSWGEVDFEVRPMGRIMTDACEMRLAEKSIGVDIEPDDIEVTDTVTLVWEIE